LRAVIPDTPKNTLVYLDPPYYVKGKGLYTNHFVHDDHVRLAEQVAAGVAGKSWVVSYDNVPQVGQLYSNFRNMVYQLSYSAAERYQGSEIMFFSDDLFIPPIPAGIPVYAA
jgi:DNA adenine methylase